MLKLIASDNEFRGDQRLVIEETEEQVDAKAGSLFQMNVERSLSMKATSLMRLRENVVKTRVRGEGEKP